MAFYGLFEDIFEIPRVLAIWRHQKISNRANIDRATAQNVKVIKISFGRFLKLRKKSLASHTAFAWPLMAFLRQFLKSLGSQLSADTKKSEINYDLSKLRAKM